MSNINEKNICACCKCKIAAGKTKCDQCAQCADKKINFMFGLGILFFPIIFTWFTLRHGYDTVVKIISVICLGGWLGVVASIFLMTTSAEADPEITDQVALTFNMKSIYLEHEQKISFFQKSTQDPYCRNPVNNQITTPITFAANYGEQSSEISISLNRIFCVVVEEGYAEHYFGPFIASEECSEGVFNAHELAHLYAPKACLVKEADQIQYNVVDISSKFAPGLEIINDDIIDTTLYERGASFLCQENYGQKVYQNMLLKFTDNGEADFFANNADVINNKEFCLLIFDATHGFTIYSSQKGPFVSTSSEGCKFQYVMNQSLFEDIRYLALYPPEGNCRSANMISFKNTRMLNGFEDLTKIEVLEKGESSDCQQGSDRGSSIATFELWPNEVQNLNVDDLLPQQDKQFCLVIEGRTHDTLRTGPFMADEGCIFDISGGNLVKSNTPDVCGGWQPSPQFPNAIRINFANVGESSSELTLLIFPDTQTTCPTDLSGYTGKTIEFSLKKGEIRENVMVDYGTGPDSNLMCIKLKESGEEEPYGPYDIKRINHCTIETSLTTHTTPGKEICPEAG